MKKYWVFVCYNHHDVGHYGGRWQKKTYDLKEFDTEEELNKYIDDVPEMQDYDFNLELLYTSHDNMEEEIGCGDD